VAGESARLVIDLVLAMAPSQRRDDGLLAAREAIAEQL